MATEDLTRRQDIPVSRNRTLQEGIEDVRTLLGERVDTILAPDRRVNQLRQENFQSRTFRAAAFDAMPERYGCFDRSLTVITFDNGAQTFIVTGRTSSGNPFEVMHATREGLDLRKSVTVIYEYDGNETIVEKLPTGRINTYQGENGRTEVLLPYIRESLGTLVSIEEFIQTEETDKKLAVQAFNLDGLRAVLHLTAVEASHDQVRDLFDSLRPKMDRDLAEGFSVYVNETGPDGHTAVYYHEPSGVGLTLTRMIFDGSAYSETLTGRYKIEGGNTIAVQVERPMNSRLLSCRVFLNDRLVASRSNPFDWAASQAEGFLKQMVVQNGENPSRLDETIKPERSPFPFVLKTLRDFSWSRPNREYTQKMFEKMQDKNENRVVWNK